MLTKKRDERASGYEDRKDLRARVDAMKDRLIAGIVAIRKCCNRTKPERQKSCDSKHVHAFHETDLQ
jgi:hypothetical protein